MTEREQQRLVNHRLAVLRHAEEVTGNVAHTCRYFGISRPTFYTWLCRYQEKGAEGLRDRSSRPHHSQNATSAEVVGKILYLRQNYHFGPGRKARDQALSVEVMGFEPLTSSVREQNRPTP
ncbi:MAG TPA: leucine zipper domain-containing protein [Acidimicrobiia bacterium]|nr:leucine zipper domain-containing protein [Acidimicrobiia bacterium]